jgi:class 3 adenylate cyclase/tetratricopeptide (TPR) repeat protein
MICQSCGRQNRGDARFCDACGASTTLEERRAPQVGVQSYTPKHLADKILRSKSCLEGERKQVTVLFADIRHSMELQEELDPEEWHEIMDRFFELVTGEIHRQEGTINQYTGDGFMALFGAPIAHEDHAQRACYAALDVKKALGKYAEELQRTRSIELSVRMGLNSGHVVVGKIGDDLRMDYSAQGHTVGLASRIEQLCRPNAVWLSEHTAQLVEGYCRFEDLGSFPIKGSRKPIRIFELRERAALRSRFDLAIQRGLTRFVGRDAEMSRLGSLLEEALAGRSVSVVLSGDPGVGKSRLCFEFLEGCRSRGIQVAFGQAPLHGSSLPFVSVLELLRAVFGIAGTSDAAESRRKIQDSIGPCSADLNARLPMLFEFLDVQDPDRPLRSIDPVDRNNQLLALVRDVIHHCGQRLPLVILLEDLHWIDDGSASVIDAISQGAAGTHILLVCTLRPHFHPKWLDGLRSRRIQLEALGSQDSAELVRTLLGDHPELAELVDLVGEHASGNPFFAEEIVRGLRESRFIEDAGGFAQKIGSLETLSIPPRVESVLAARIDRLPAQAKSALQDAAVIGRRVPWKLLGRVSELSESELLEAVEVLMRAHFIHELADAEETTYAFVHPLTHSVAHQSQLARLRRGRHIRAATALEESEAERPREYAALLAHHWESAGENLRAAQAGARLARWLVKSDVGQSFQQWSKVHQLLADLPESEETRPLLLRACAAMLRFGWRQGLAPDAAAILFEQAQDLARRIPDARIETFLSTSYGRMLGTIESADAFLKHTRDAAQIAEKIGDDAIQLVVDVTHCQALGWAGQLRDSLALAENILVRGEGHSERDIKYLGFSSSVWARAQRGWLLTDLGRLTEARRDLVQAIEVAREEHQLDIVPMASRAYVVLQCMLGDADTAMNEARKAVDAAEQVGSPYALVGGYWGLGLALLMQRRGIDAAQALERALAIANERVVYLESEGSMLALLAEAEMQKGEIARSHALAEQSVQCAQRRGMRVSEGEALLSLARVLLAGGSEANLDQADGCLERVFTLVEESGARSLEAFAWVERARLARVRDDEPGRNRHLTRARQVFLEMEAPLRAGVLARSL